MEAIHLGFEGTDKEGSGVARGVVDVEEIENGCKRMPGGVAGWSLLQLVNVSIRSRLALGKSETEFEK